MNKIELTKAQADQLARIEEINKLSSELHLTELRARSERKNRWYTKPHIIAPASFLFGSIWMALVINIAFKLAN
ncbi:hypothetical protein [Aurantiacibacter aquimixticola]|uniref:Uncharacterized protein n=1 Tax=Aurantiacibacter aquimixticola TaxID=1958945 RepID=A0A419RW48_9SPHN|nr:hypothetical protein [Aurantiacibacter aquimixticola]RJY09993.1 hypothetical protein D6201_12095 [Aurantiacibacter aquimixticola]